MPLFGERLRQARLAAGVKHDALASAIGSSRTHLLDVEFGRRGPLRRDQITAAAEYLGVSPVPLIEAAIMDRGSIQLEAPSPFVLAVAVSLGSAWGKLSIDDLQAIGTIAARVADED